MTKRRPFLPTSALAALAAPSALLAAQEVAPEGAPITAALEALGADVQVYNDHIVTLASPYMDGRLPGTNGMELAKEYCEYWLARAGVAPGFDGDWRQPFPLGGTLRVTEQALAAGGESFVAGRDFVALGLGASGSADGELVFVGYSIQDGPDGYSTFSEGDDLTGKVALMVRFEPMDAAGKSRWTDASPWSAKAGFTGKVRATAARNPAAILIANAPGADDPRTNELQAEGGGGRRVSEVPVLHLTTDAADRMLRAAGAPSLLELRQRADAGGGITPLGSRATVGATLVRESLHAENVAGLLAGRGDLADEFVLIGAHLDHLGMGAFGSRSGAGQLHPGADDNASGSAAILMLAEKLVRRYEELPSDADARSILFVLFSGEESGLNGSRFYVENPVVPLERHALMINFDMIGRILNDRVRISGTDSAAGMGAWLQGVITDTDLTVMTEEQSFGGSDHLPFLRRKVPILFGSIADFHGDYHTPEDTSAKINRLAAAKTVRLFDQILFAAATRAEPFVFTEEPSDAPTAAPASSLGAAPSRVRFGVVPGADDGSPGVAITSVSNGAPASTAGVLAGDRLVKWNGAELDGIGAWMELLGAHSPGDEVELQVLRNGARLTLHATLVPAR